ncbi:MAG: ATP-binding protein [bacterium]|nr:ATP-binding protein [bacterium]
MEELSLHILDIVENSMRAGATRIEIRIQADPDQDTFIVEVNDNGIGMDAEELTRATEPFYTTKAGKKVGLGLALLSQAAELAGGKVAVTSQAGKGTTVQAIFQYSHIDRQPLGNIAETVLGLIVTHPDINFIYNYDNKVKKIYLDTNEVKKQINPYLINSPEGIQKLRKIVAR